jgi:Penicillin binding protein transpeptidase domain
MGKESVTSRKRFAALGLVVVFVLMVLPEYGMAATVSTRSLTGKKPKSQKVSEAPRARKRLSKLSRSRARTAVARTGRRHRRRYYERFTASSFMNDNFDSDVTTGEDPIVRQAALDALGNMNGTVLAIEPTSGRVLAMVNQKLALSSGAQPCSTIKLSVALAALSEDLITKDTQIALGRRSRMNLTTALAHSNNAYFEALGRKLGFEKVSFYAHQFGLGELAGYNISGEQLGTYPQQEISSKLGGVGKMCSFGEGISMTPLQLGAMVSAIANGGTLYYLQHPATSLLSFQRFLTAWQGQSATVPRAACESISTKRKFWERRVRAPRPAPVTDGLLPTPKRMSDASLSLSSCKEDVQPSDRKPRKFLGACIAISMTTNSSWPTRHCRLTRRM